MEKEDKINYGLKLRSYRDKLNLTQEEVVNRAKEFIDKVYKEDNDSNVKKTCFNQNQLSNWEKGKYIPHHTNKHLLSVVYNVPPEELEFKENTELFVSEDEIEKVMGDLYNAKNKEAFENGTHINKNYLIKLHLNNNWDIQKKVQFIIDLHIEQGLIIPKHLLDTLNENDEEKKSKMYYEYYINFYNGALYASTKKK